jgi:hypothetical protein
MCEIGRDAFLGPFFAYSPQTKVNLGDVLLILTGLDPMATGVAEISAVAVYRSGNGEIGLVWRKQGNLNLPGIWLSTPLPTPPAPKDP